MKNKYLKALVLLIIIVAVSTIIIFVGGRVPQIQDKNIHPLSVSHVDTTAFNNGTYHFPGATWKLYENPAELGWSESIFESLDQKADSLETAALMIIHKGVLVYDWGATDEEYITQSMRKGLLNSIYGIYWDRGIINLDTTLNELGINDTPPLTNVEKTATVEQLLQSTSGIYHSALYEVGSWKRNKPERGAHKPGEKWYYNNWGFNALGTIFEQLSGEKIGDTFEREIAIPLHMQDFEAADVTYITRDNWGEKMMGNESEHPAYMFSASARDMARFGLLYLNNGKWEDKQVLSQEWIEKSWDPVDIEMYYTLKFGYLWWVFKDGIIYRNKEMGFEGDIYFTSGNRGHALFVIPHLDLVVVHRVYIKGVDFWSQLKRGMLGLYAEVDDDEVYDMLEMIRKAHPHYQ